MQHNPRTLLPELKTPTIFLPTRLWRSRWICDFILLKDLLLDVSLSVASHPFVVEFCLMFAFCVPKNGAAIYMISCNTVSLLFYKIASILKAAVWSVSCSFSEQAFTTSSNVLVKSVREAPILHIEEAGTTVQHLNALSEGKGHAGRRFTRSAGKKGTSS